MTCKSWIPPLVGMKNSSMTDADVAAWIEDLRQAMLDIGLVQTADTGQFDASSFGPVPTVVSSYNEVTYLMFAFDDPLQAIAPIFVRLGIGSCVLNATTAATFMSAVGRVSVGTATDGAGQLTQDAVGPFGISVANSSSSTSPPPPVAAQSYGCFSPELGFLGLMFSPAINGVLYNLLYARYPVFSFGVERIPDPLTGQPTAEGFSVWVPHALFTANSAYNIDSAMSNVVAAGQITQMTSLGVSYSPSPISPFFPAGPVLKTLGKHFVHPVMHCTPEPIRSNGLGSIQQDDSALPYGSGLSVALYGTPRDYVVFDSRSAFLTLLTPTRCVPCMLME